MGAFPPSPASTRRHCGSNGRSAICSGSCPSGFKTSGPGSITAGGAFNIRTGYDQARQPRASITRFCQLKARRCIRSRSALCMRASRAGTFRFTANGETIVRLRSDWATSTKAPIAHGGRAIERAAKLAGRVSGDSTVAYAIAFARAVRRHWHRRSARALAPGRDGRAERIANHLGDIGAICNDAAFSLMLAHCGALRERVLRTSDVCFGHRLMMDRVVPGGVACDLDEDGANAIRSLIAEIRRQFPELVELYENTTSLQDRTVTTGILNPGLAHQYGAGGYIGRASGRGFDAPLARLSAVLRDFL